MKTGNTCRWYRGEPELRHASMEPGHEDREYAAGGTTQDDIELPQWSPVMKTGNTSMQWYTLLRVEPPQWSPVMKTGNTWGDTPYFHYTQEPQWSPVMKTGNTRVLASASPM